MAIHVRRIEVGDEIADSLTAFHPINRGGIPLFYGNEASPGGARTWIAGIDPHLDRYKPSFRGINLIEPGNLPANGLSKVISYLIDVIADHIDLIPDQDGSLNLSNRFDRRSNASDRQRRRSRR